jgi:cytoskeletal protein RodZ
VPPAPLEGSLVGAAVSPTPSPATNAPAAGSLHEEPKKKSNWLIWVIALVAIAIVVLGGLYVVGRGQGANGAADNAIPSLDESGNAIDESTSLDTTTNLSGTETTDTTPTDAATDTGALPAN